MSAGWAASSISYSKKRYCIFWPTPVKDQIPIRGPLSKGTTTHESKPFGRPNSPAQSNCIRPRPTLRANGLVPTRGQKPGVRNDADIYKAKVISFLKSTWGVYVSANVCVIRCTSSTCPVNGVLDDVLRQKQHSAGKMKMPPQLRLRFNRK